MDIHIGIWAKNVTVLETVLTQFGLMTDGRLHDQLRLSGAGYGGWSGILVDANGTALPGVYANAWALDIPREVSGKKSLARNLRHRVMADRSEVKIDQEDVTGKRKRLLDRVRLADEATKLGGVVVNVKGKPSDPKMPERIEISQSGEVVFAAYSLEPDDETKPATPRCVWA